MDDLLAAFETHEILTKDKPLRIKQGQPRITSAHLLTLVITCESCGDITRHPNSIMFHSGLPGNTQGQHWETVVSPQTVLKLNPDMPRYYRERNETRIACEACFGGQDAKEFNPSKGTYQGKEEG